MDKTQAYKIAQEQLLKVEDDGFDQGLSLVDEPISLDVIGEDGVIYDTELRYSWVNKHQKSIRVTCNVTSKNWYQHQQLSESIVLTKPKI